VRVTLQVPEKKGMLANLSNAIAQAGGNIISLGTFLGQDPNSRQIIVKVADIDKDKLVEAIQSVAARISDVRVV
jgi:acetoin utilization protein AcuB